MSTWGSDCWENDAAADWFMELFDRSSIVEYVDETLKLDPTGHWEEIRAAVFVMTQLARPYVWPQEHLERQIDSAVGSIDRIESLAANVEEGIPEWVIESLRLAKKELQGRL
jgi:hypothetical protein